MIRRERFILFGLILSSLCLAGQKQGPTLYPGLTAPPLEVSRWVKGGAVKELPAKGIAVIEFWATWCEPCIEAIPHLTELAHQHKDVDFIGLSVDNVDSAAIDKFVTKEGDKMDYHVGFAGIRGGMASSYLDAALQPGIPVAFIVKDRVLQWVGGTDELAYKLEDILAGRTLASAEQKAFLAQFNVTGLGMEQDAKLSEADQMFGQGGYKGAHEAIAGMPASDGLEILKLRWKSVEDKPGFVAGIRDLAKSNADKAGQTVLSVLAYHGVGPVAKTAIDAAIEADHGASPYLYFCAVNICVHNMDKKGEKGYARQALKLLAKRKNPDDADVLQYFKGVLKR